jgi:Domain of unknown function (DUF1937)
MTPDKLCYIASPYTRTPNIDLAFEQIARITAQLSISGLTAFSPIVHGHSMVRAANLDHTDPAAFAALNKKMLHISDILIVVWMEGWNQSTGVKEEIAYFESMHKPIYDYDPVTLVMKRRD